MSEEAEVPAAPKTNFPGSINYEDKHGCKAVKFESVDEMNEFFAVHNNTLVAGIFPSGSGGYLVLYTLTLEAIQQQVDEKRAARLKHAKEMEERAEKQNAETQRLAKLGLAAEQDKLNEKAHELKELRARIRRFVDKTQAKLLLKEGDPE
jgi:hypothetical protein